MEMSRGTFRTLFAGLALALALTLAAPTHGEAAGPRREETGPAFTDVVRQWVMSLFERIGLHIDPNGSRSGNIGWHVDPDGVGWHIDPNGGNGATTNGEGGDIGWGIDPNG
jgi:hypothetical protein